MSIVTKIKRSVESATGLTMHYHDEGTINEIIYSSPMPCCFFALLRDTELLTDGSQNRERASIAMFFVDKTEFDFDSEENEEIIERCKTKANTWIRSLINDSTLTISGSLRMARVYNEYDEILTGIAVNVTLEETYGFNACTDEEFEPTRVLKITENGLYNVHEYYWVEVEFPPTIDVYMSNGDLCVDGLTIDENNNIILEER